MKKTLCTILAACCVFFAACGVSGGNASDSGNVPETAVTGESPADEVTEESYTVTAYKGGKAVTVSDDNADKLVALAEKSLDSDDMIQLALTLDQADYGVYVLIEFPEERELNDGSEYPVKTDCLEIITGTSEGALILTCDGGRVYRAGSNDGAFAGKVKSYLE